MAGIEVDEGDLIDLNSRVCADRVNAGSSPLTIEEQEHLLDVCPPKLEQKLSLTLQKKNREILLKDADIDSTDDVLVTLGHDKVVPVAKRIDVVSSDTIKRVKDITKNLEPVIQRALSIKGETDSEDAVDSKAIFNDDKDSNESFETREINNAFNFLKELDCYEEDIVEKEEEEEEDSNVTNESISSEGPLMEDIFYRRNSNRGIDFGFEKGGSFDNADYGSNDSSQFCNFGFDVSTHREKNRFQNVKLFRPTSLDYDILTADSCRSNNCNRLFLSKSNSLRDSVGDRCCSNYDEGPNILPNGRLRRSFHIRSERKSWSEGVIEDSSSCDKKFDKNYRRDIIDSQKPSTSNGFGALHRSDISIRTELEDDSSETSSTSSSSASDVDWSWVEEVESSRAKAVMELEENKQQQKQLGNNNHHQDQKDEQHSEEEEEEDNKREGTLQEEEITPTNSPKSKITKRMRQPGNTATNSTDSTIVMSGVTTAKSLPLPISGCPGPPDEITTHNRDQNSSNNNNNNNNIGTSWVRASMRRLRHLRLPDADEEREVPGRELTATTSSSSFNNLSTSTVQSGSNSLPDIALIAPEILAAQTNGNNTVELRPSSAPNGTTRVFGPTATSPGRGRLNGGRSRGRNEESGRSSLQSRNNGSDSSCSTSSDNSTATSPASTPNATPQHAASGRRICERQRGAERDDERGEDDDEDENPLGRWPHALSPALACLGCTLGLFNISRFAILSIQFGANFIVQFLVLSLILGIPLFTLQVCLGQRLAAGAVDMWRISPLFQGVGIALLTAQAFIGVYSIVGISWMFVYFRDSFITKQDRYRWAEPFLLYRDDTKPTHNGTHYKLQETVPDYFSGAVLQRHHLNEPDTGIVTLKFQVAFNLAVVWMIVFVSLSKGLRSYGKVVYVFTLVPVFGTLVLCAKLLGLTPTGSIHQLFPATVWSEFFINGKSWMAASTEVFLTWGLFGAAAMQIAAHNKHKHLLQRDTSLVVVLTFVVLLLSAFLANTCVQILRHHGYIYTTSSFESISGYTFMHLVNQPIHPGQGVSPERFMNHASFLAGQRVDRHGADLSTESGYQVLRLATELVPATLAMLGSEQVSPFWAVLFYFILILFGIAQQLAIWHCVITGIMAINTKMMKLWETTITFFSCACGYILGLPMATEFGIYVVYYLDYTVGGAWWIMVLYLVEVGAVFAVRGRPHTGEAVVAELFPPTGRCLRNWAGPLLSFTWNVVLPVALMVLSIMIFKSSSFRDLYTYRRSSRDYWAIWARQLGAAIQLIPILMIPIVAIIQTCRYLNSGPPDIFDRIQLLYRPSLEPDDAADPQTQIGSDTTTSLHGNGILPSTTDVPIEDPPPKYTPPPSYTTATGARIAKMLRQSFRRSVRRIANVLGESSIPRPRPALQPPPPDYATVLVEMNQGIPSRDISIIVTEAGPDVTDVINGMTNSLERRRPNTIDRTMRISTIDRSTAERSHSTMDRSRRTHTNNGSSNLTAADVANLLRSSIRRGASRNQQSLHRNFSSNEPTAAVSIENLVEAAAPIGQDSLVLPKDESLVSEQGGNDDKKTVDQTENATTVI